MRGKVFKEYYQNQGMVLPPYLEDMISESHIARVVDRVIEGMDVREIMAHYKGGGAPSYHPFMMLKIIIYGYIEGVYTSRKIAKATRENVVFMWLSGRCAPDFRTINNFRLKFRELIESVFKEVIRVGMELGLVEFNKMFVDGTKIEANSNKHKIIWRKNVERMENRIGAKIEGLLKEIERLNEEEEEIYGDKDLAEVEGEKGVEGKEIENKGKEAGERINKRLKRERQRAERQLNKAEKQKEENRKKKEKLGKRNGYSKTDETASPMMTKGGEIKPCYNFLIGTENQMILSYEVEQNASDGSCFKSLMEKAYKTHKKVCKSVCGDAAFGNAENYEYCEEKGIEAYLKYGRHYIENKKSFKEDKFRKENFERDEKEDAYICPNGEKLKFIEEREDKTATGYTNRVKIYRCEKCGDCKYKSECTKGRLRTIQINEKYERYKKEASERLNTPYGKELRKQRGVEVESVFGNIKHNGNHKRFNLRGLEKVRIEAGLWAIAHNIKKIYQAITEKKTKESQKPKRNLCDLILNAAIFLQKKTKIIFSSHFTQYSQTF